MDNIKAKDPLTGDLFTPKRSNQKFANRKNQIRFNNEKQNKNRKENLMVNRQLQKNKNCYKSILGTEKVVIKSADYLLGAGVKTWYYTHEMKDGSQRVYCCYDYCIIPLENDKFKIFKHA
jgi:hypothetical protein